MNDKTTYDKYPGTGFAMQMVCEVCGKRKANWDHRKCSKIKQAKYEQERYKQCKEKN